MPAKSYSKEFKIQVAEDALKPENERAVEILAVKYGIQPRTVVKWRNMYKENGPKAFNKGYMTANDKRYPDNTRSLFAGAAAPLRPSGRHAHGTLPSETSAHGFSPSPRLP